MTFCFALALSAGRLGAGNGCGARACHALLLGRLLRKSYHRQAFSAVLLLSGCRRSSSGSSRSRRGSRRRSRCRSRSRLSRSWCCSWSTPWWRSRSRNSSRCCSCGSGRCSGSVGSCSGRSSGGGRRRRLVSRTASASIERVLLDNLLRDAHPVFQGTICLVSVKIVELLVVRGLYTRKELI